MIMEFLKKYLPYILIVIGVILLRTYIVTPIKVNGSSMYNTLNGNEIMLLWKIGEIKRFDIVVTKTEEETLIKRVYALPGETIECRDGDIWINDEKIDDQYAFGETADFSKVTLKEDEYFIMGDNRLVSLDSRKIGPVHRKQIKGTTNFIIFPFNKIGTVDK